MRRRRAALTRLALTPPSSAPSPAWTTRPLDGAGFDLEQQRHGAALEGASPSGLGTHHRTLR
jgi:hypothetical protein